MIDLEVAVNDIVIIVFQNNIVAI